MSRSIVFSLATVVAIVSGKPVFASQTGGQDVVVLFMCPAPFAR
jgi:hypothetical protein